MKKSTTLTLIASIITAGVIMTSCQNNKTESNPDIKQVDTPMVPEDINKPAAQDTTKPDTTNNMKDNTPKKKPLTLVIDNLGSPTAPVEVSVYKPDDKFPSEKGQSKKYRFTPTGNTLTATITDLEYGEYAVATYQDLDADGKIGKNMIGIPTDPYAFSNNYVPKIKAPAFKDCAFAYDDKSSALNIKMIRK